MLTKDRILPEVGKIWWENNNVMMNFIHNHLSREGAAIFTLEHCVSQSTFRGGSAKLVGNYPYFEARYMIENMAVEKVREPMINEGPSQKLGKVRVSRLD
jgi:hypothetical protein